MYAGNLPEPLAPAAAVLREGEAAQGVQAAAGVVPHPADAVRLDRIDHLPEVEGKISKCCRMKGCKLRTLTRCTKCKVFLCLKATKNCFLQYHTVK